MWKSSLFIVFVSLVLHSCSGESLAPALYVFGDSVVESGNNVHLSKGKGANYLPYGIDHPNGPTGRWTNGKTIVDFIADFLGLPLAPASLGLSDSQKQKTKTGVNFASGGSGILDETQPGSAECLPLNKQIDFFEETVEKYLPGQFANTQELSSYLSKAIFFISAGSNDFFNGLFKEESVHYGRDPDDFAKHLTGKYAQALQRLYKLGARKLLVARSAEVGCTLKFTTNGTSACDLSKNESVKKYNALLSQLLQNLSSELKGSMWSEVNISPHLNFSGYGLKNYKDTCCYVGERSLCNETVKTPCENRNEYYFFDRGHPTEVVHKIHAEHCYYKTPSICTPTLDELIRSCPAPANS